MSRTLDNIRHIGYGGPGSGNNWSDSFRSVTGNYMLMSSGTFDQTYGNGSYDMYYHTVVNHTGSLGYRNGVSGIWYQATTVGNQYRIGAPGTDFRAGFDVDVLSRFYGFNEDAGQGGHDGMDYVNAFVGAVGSYFGLTGNMFHNELYWVQKNGTLRSTQILNNSNKIYRTSYNVVKESFATAKVWSNRMATLGLVTTGIDIVVDGQIRPSHMVNLTMAGISYTGVGSLVAGGYWITDMGFEVFTEYSLGDRLDQWLDPQHGASGSW